MTYREMIVQLQEKFAERLDDEVQVMDWGSKPRTRMPNPELEIAAQDYPDENGECIVCGGDLVIGVM